MFQRFKERAEAVSAEVHRFTGKPEAVEHVLALLEREGASAEGGGQAIWAPCPFLEGLDLARIRRRLPGLRFEVTREGAAAAKVGLSQVDWAIAETGTLVQDATAVEQRLVSTLPSLHVAIAATSRIVPDLATLLTRLHPERTPYMSFVTGPSRTADIERVLTIGVHGPERLVILFVDDL